LNGEISQQTNLLDSIKTEIADKQGKLDSLNSQIAEAKRVQFADKQAKFVPGDKTALQKANETRQAKIAARREQVLALLGEGLTSRQIADRLKVSIGTIKADRQKLNGRAREVTQ